MKLNERRGRVDRERKPLFMKFHEGVERRKEVRMPVIMFDKRQKRGRGHIALGDRRVVVMRYIKQREFVF